jgi:VWFA-related protein
MILCAALLCTCALANLYSARPAQPEPRLVNLNLVAVDNDGQPVRDLTSDDFQVIDAGKMQKIAFFHHSDIALRSTPRPAINEFSNRNGANIPYATVILFDLMNLSMSSRGVAQYELIRYLANLETADYLFLYILTVDGRLFIVHGLPGTVEQSDASSGAPWTRRIKASFDDAFRKVPLQRPVYVDVAGRVFLTFRALEILAEQLSTVPGRKNIVWVTDGVPIELGPGRSDTGDFVDFTPQIRKLGEQLNQSRIAIYPVRQVMPGSADGIGGTSGVGETGGAGTGLASDATLNEFAGMTGGRPDQGKDIRPVIQQALNDMHTSYEMGYYPPPRNWDNKFHKLRVTCKRKGVRIEAQTGYFAWAEATGTRAQQAFNMAASTTFDAAEIGLHAGVSVDPKDGRVTHFDLHIDAHDLAWVHQGDAYLAQLRLTVVHYLAGGRTEAQPITPVNLDYTAQERDAALNEGIDFAENTPAGQGGYKFRILVFDRGSDAIGTLTIPDYDNSRLVLPRLGAQ